MPENIISQWLNLSSVKVINATVGDKITDIYLTRDKSNGFVCSKCGKTFATARRWKRTRVRDLDIFEFQPFLLFSKYRTDCPCCGVRAEKIDFLGFNPHYTRRFEEKVARLCRITSVKQVAELLELDWKTVKEIDKRYLTKQFAVPDYEDLNIIAIDEIASHKGHNYFTVVLDLQRTRVIWVGKDRSKQTLDKFFKELGPERCKNLKAIALDMWNPYLASIWEYAPHIKEVFDKFHVLNAYSRVIDKVRNTEYNKAVKTEKEVIKGSKYLLLKNKENLTRTSIKDEKKHLRKLLRVNKKINLTYILKDDLKRLWDYRYPGSAYKFLDSWVQRATAARIKPLTAFAKMLWRYRRGLINHCYYPIDTAKLEGMNNKIKVIKRIAYGFHDDDYFILKIKQACSREPPVNDIDYMC